MKKLFKDIFIKILTIGSILGMESVIMFNLMCAGVYAKTKEEKPLLKSIYISDGYDIDLSEDVYSYIVDVSDEDEEIYIKPKPEDENYFVRINGELASKDDKYKKSVNLNMGKNKIIIEVSDNKKFSDDEYYKKYSEQEESEEDFDNISISKYIIYVFRGGDSTIYLNNITIDGRNIGFIQTNRVYNLEIDTNDELIEFQFDKFDKYDTILVNNNILRDSDSLKIKFRGVGKYTVNVDILDNDTNRKGSYLFNIYYGIPVTPNVSDSINSVLKPNQWVIVNGRWQRNDSFGQAITNSWFYDDEHKAYFYFNNRGNMKTGWLTLNGNTYYLGNNGEMKTGWVKDDDKWYYFDENGVMRTGWIKDDDNWYYMDKDGSMKTGWLLDNGKWYYLNNDGKMKTGWMLKNRKWYYLNSDGSMGIGWIKYNGDWYYMNNDGSMKSGEWIKQDEKWYYINYSGTMRCGWLNKDEKYYYFNEDGSMETNPKVIDGYLYKFNEDGSVNFEN